MSEIVEEIESSIDNGKINTLDELSKEFNIIEKNFYDNFPNIPQKKEVWLSYVTKWYEFATVQLYNKYEKINKDKITYLNKQLEDANNNSNHLLKDKKEKDDVTTSHIHTLENNINKLKKQLIEYEKIKSNQDNVIETYKLDKNE